MVMSRTKFPVPTCSAKAGTPRRGVVTLELIVVTPIIAIMLSAVIEFGIMLASIEQITASARAGGKIATELSNADLGNVATAVNVDLVKAAVDRVLGSAGMTSCMVILEHNPDCNGLVAATKTSGVCAGCAAPATALPTTAVIPSGTVRVTVCVEATQLAPNLLSTFGYDLTGQVVSESITLPYENCP
jgi:Flp pilus assembly protein TadG